VWLKDEIDGKPGHGEERRDVRPIDAEPLRDAGWNDDSTVEYDADMEMD
jgi:hypothetical protein